jgi:hypothetical protein
MKTSIHIKILYTTAAFFFFSYMNCSDGMFSVNTDQDLPVIMLENQNDHSGIMFLIIELDTILTTNSRGELIYSFLPDGFYQAITGYPYYQKVKSEISVENGRITQSFHTVLKQQAGFRIEAPETTWVRGMLHELMFYAENLTDSTLTLAGYFEPLIMNAFVPVNSEWPDLPDQDSGYCRWHYGALKRNDFTAAPATVIEAGSMNTYYKTLSISSDCLPAGKYRIFLTITDLSRYPIYFDYRYFDDTGDVNYEKYFFMNQSLLKKDHLIEPAIIDITN